MSALEIESLLQKMAALQEPTGDWPRGAGFEFEGLYNVLKKIHEKILRAEAVVVDHRIYAVYDAFVDDLRQVAISVDDNLHKFSSGTSFSSFAKRSLYHMLRGGAGGSQMPFVLIRYHPAFILAKVLGKMLAPLVGHTVEVVLRPEIAKQFEEAQRDLQMMLRLFSTYVVDLLPKHQEMVSPKNVWDQSFSSLRGLIGRDQDVEKIMEVLDASETEVVAVVGMAGVGKTAFISEVCRKYAAKGEVIVYHRLSQNFDTEMIFRGLMTSLSELEPAKDPESYWWCMKEGLVNQKYLVVLDDVWNEDPSKWNQLLQLLRGQKTLRNKIIVTTRIPAVAAAIEESVTTHDNKTLENKIIVTTRIPAVEAPIQSVTTHDILPLSIEASLKLLNTISKDNLRKNHNAYGFNGSITRNVAERCSGLPKLVYLMESFLKREDIYQKGAMQAVEAFDQQCMGDKELLDIAKASYNHLPSHLQRCFLYCSLFPLDHVFDVEALSALCIAEGLTQVARRDAQGLIQVASREAQVDGDLSKLLDECFEIFDESGTRGKMRYKMQFIMHNFARIEGQKLYKAIKVEEYTRLRDQSIRYLSLMVDSTTKILPQSLIEQKDLRTLILHRKQYMVLSCQKSEIRELPLDYCLYLKALRVLDLHATRIHKLPEKFDMLSNLRYLNLSQTDIATLPDFIGELHDLIYLNIAQTCIEHVDTIGKIRSLRHLNLSETAIRNLPDTFGGLRSLQTLQLSHCKKLVMLSKDIALLTNLQKLDLEGCHCLTEMPLYISTMKNLKELNILECSSLQRMPVGLRSLTKIEALPRYIVTKHNSKAILELQGLENMKILGLDNVDRISIKDAEKIKLQNMKTLEHLALHCSTDAKSTSTSRKVEDIFDHLNPYCGLKTLEIIRYEGKRFPSWMSDKRRQLKNLAHIRLINLKCRSLQVLGKLPCLTNLEICGMDAITKFGKELNGEVTFPSLKKLTFSQMLKLESWPEDGAKCNCLEELSIIQCPKFQKLSMKKLPLKKLTVCMNPHQLLSKEGLAGLAGSTTLKSMSISLCEELSSLSNIEGLKALSSLEKLEISECDELESLPPGLEDLASLKTLSFVRCRKLCRLFASSDSSTQTSKHISSLEELEISGCGRLESLSLVVESLASLRRLSVTCCRNLYHLEAGTSLKSLGIFDCPNVAPLLHLSSLEVLEISGYDDLETLESLLQGVVENLPSLMSLSVVSCRKLKDVSCLQKCTRLRSLCISDCPNVIVTGDLNKITTRE